MGIVYRARDTKLNRDVAFKILPEPFAADPKRIARFKREAQVLPSLNHPNIAAIYGQAGLDRRKGSRAGEAGAAGRTVGARPRAVEEPMFADVISRGPIALDEALPIAHEMPMRWKPRQLR